MTADDGRGDTGSFFTSGLPAEPGPEPPFPAAWASRDDLAEFSPAPGITMRSFSGGALMVNWVRLDPGQPIPFHRHPHEQIGVILEGGMELTIGDETRQLRPDDMYVAPPHLAHGGRAHDDGCLVLDAFTPVREDYRAMADAAGPGANQGD